MMSILLLIFASASAEPWYFPNETDVRATLGPTTQVGDSVLVGLTKAGLFPRHPDVVDAMWVSHRAGIAKLRVRAGADPLEISRVLHGRSDVRWSHPDFVMDKTLHALPNDPYVTEQWHLENTGQRGAVGADINAERAWEITTGEGQLISVIDSGVNLDHPDIAGISGRDYVDRDDDNYPESENGHGTACAGLAAGIGNNEEGIAGVAYGAEVYGVRLLGGQTSMSDTYNAFVSSVDAGASVISNSWGYRDSCDGYALPQILKEALVYAEDKGRDGLGTVVVQAAGNSDCDISSDGLLRSETVFAVAALNANDDKEGYSSYGDPIDIAAPSGGLLTTNLNGVYRKYEDSPLYTDAMSGTSASTPLVAGVFALMFAANERLTAEDAREIVCQTATRNDIIDGEFDENGWSQYYGCGRVDAGAAVHAVANVAPEAPVSTMTVETVYSDRIWLDWAEAVDADEDRLTYRVKYWTEEEARWGKLPTEQVVSTNRLEISGAAGARDVLHWQVQATDLWGDGPWSDVYTLDVVARPRALSMEMPAGCQVSAVGGGWLGMLAVVAIGRRRRTPTE